MQHHGIIATLLMLGAGPSALAVPLLTPFINELHYDNAGPDLREFVELAGPAQSLLGWSLVFYNGGSGTPYRSLSLDLDIPDQDNGFGAAAVSVTGIQNGPADGVALLDPLSNVVEWLSYEGVVLASAGPAAGLSSSDIGVAETSQTPLGTSLQRIGSGLFRDDFSWAAEAPSSPGSINAGQMFLSTEPMAVAEPASLPLLLLGLLALGLGWVSRRRNPIPVDVPRHVHQRDQHTEQPERPRQHRIVFLSQR